MRGPIRAGCIANVACSAQSTAVTEGGSTMVSVAATSTNGRLRGDRPTTGGTTTRRSRASQAPGARLNHATSSLRYQAGRRLAPPGCSLVPVEIRTIEPTEFRDFVHAMRRVFLVAAPSDDEVEFMRQRFDLSRTWAAFDKRKIVATFHSFPTPLTVPGGVVAADAVTVVTVAPTHRRQGVLTSLMGIDLAEAAKRGDAASILLSAEYPIYGRFGYGSAADEADYTIDTRSATFSGPYAGTVELCELAELRETCSHLRAFRCPTVSIERTRSVGHQLASPPAVH